MTTTLEHTPPNARLLVAAAVVPVAAVGVIASAVLLVLVGPWGLLAGLVLTGVAVWLRARSLTHGLRASVVAALGARPVDPADAARLVNLAEGLSATSGVPVPDLFVVDDPAANLLLVGERPEAPAMVVTSGLLASVDRVPLEGLVARAFAELRRGELPASTIAVRAAGRRIRSAGSATAAPARLGAALAHLADPDRDLELDRAAAGLTRYPPGLVAALERLQEVGTAVAVADPATSHLWIVDPCSPPADPDRPSLDLRIEALRLL